VIDLQPLLQYGRGFGVVALFEIQSLSCYRRGRRQKQLAEFGNFLTNQQKRMPTRILTCQCAANLLGPLRVSFDWRLRMQSPERACMA
jgi:hypothetical protein